MRVCIDKKFFVGLWYKVIGRGPDCLPSIKRHPTLIDPPEPVSFFLLKRFVPGHFVMMTYLSDL